MFDPHGNSSCQSIGNHGSMNLQLVRQKGALVQLPYNPLQSLIIFEQWNLITFYNIKSLRIIANYQSINSFLKFWKGFLPWSGTFKFWRCFLFSEMSVRNINPPWSVGCNVTWCIEKICETLPSAWCYGGWQPYCISLDEKLVARESPGVDSVDLICQVGRFLDSW